MGEWAPIEPLDIDFETYGVERAAEERQLLAEVRNHVEAPWPAAQAASVLLRWYSKYGDMHDKEVQGVIERGMRAVTLKVARAGLTKEGRCPVKPLDYFDGERGDGQRRPPKPVMQDRLEYRREFKDWLTVEELKAVLTERDKKVIPIDKRPKSIEEVEQWLLHYMQGRYSGIEDRELLEFIHASFPDWPWEQKKTPLNWRS